ncbi:Imm27 family immunity protein [Paraglaciecola marina]|uniref:Imm27 family immunity protein n=1 Tax=Paraglaciecola marina TaxID=2500157 RepID=UPI00105CBC32|nr:Imm27 family immunity protein [Paraglaciecola marina]
MGIISGSETVKSYINANLVKVATDDSGWNALYLNKIDNQYWVLTYPRSEVHGGGHLELQKITELSAKRKFCF